MSTSVWGHVAPAGKHHPTAKWSLLMVLLAVVVLGVPNLAVASPPSVQSPTGPQSGGVFTGPFTFGTYISCSGGLNFSDSYTSNLDGTHTFAFWGAPDGSLLVSVDGGGRQLLTSCGDPFTGSSTNVANYTVSKNTGPTPTPTPPPTPVPTPTPPPAGGGSTPTPAPGGGSSGGGSSSGGSSGSSSGSSGGSSAGHTGTAASGAGADVSAAAGDTPAPAAGAPESAAPAAASGGGATPLATPRPAGAAHTPAPAAPASPRTLALAAAGFISLLLLILAYVAWRSRRVRSALESNWRRAAVRLEPYTFRLRRLLARHIHIRALAEAKRRGFSHHHHSGKLIAHHHTSYPALAFLLLLTTVLTAAVSASSHAADSQLSLTVLGPPPTVGATIDQPVDGDTFTVATQTVRGACPLGLMVEIYRNMTFAGSTICDSGGLYNLIITLVPGTNDLVARDIDGLNQYGPDSTTVTVTYIPPPPTPTPTPTPTPASTPSAGGAATPTPKPKATATPKPTAKPVSTPKATPVPVPPFYIESPSHFFQGASPDETVNWQVRLHGGTAPYVVTWSWGDGHEDTVPASTAGPLMGSHTYAQPGAYRITVRAIDASGAEAVIQLTAIINGGPSAAYTRPIEPPGNLIYIWPLIILASLMVLSFWLGERHKVAVSPIGHLAT